MLEKEKIEMKDRMNRHREDMEELKKTMIKFTNHYSAKA